MSTPPREDYSPNSKVRFTPKEGESVEIKSTGSLWADLAVISDALKKEKPKD